MTQDTLTLLKTAGKLRMTKRWCADGTIAPYDTAKNFQVTTLKLSSINGLEKMLDRYAGQPQYCLIRGQFIGQERAAQVFTEELPGHVHRINELFDDVPHHWFVVDIDGYIPDDGIDPVREPVKAIEQYIAKRLPACFQGVTYLWQLSASAGAPGKQHLLKAHLFFWLKTPYTGAQLTAWARQGGLELDVAVLRRVQANYIAAPVFDEGVTDPVPVRRGRVEGWDGDEVALVIDEATLAQAHEIDAGTGGTDLAVVDPKEKPGWIGAFCRAYTIEEVIENWLGEVFEFSEPGNDRRLNHLGTDSGTPGGAWIHDGREHIQSNHASDPLGGALTNKWDLVRHYKFGHLDEGKDAFELMDISARPSHLAMVEFASGLEPVRAQMEAAKGDVQDKWRVALEGAGTLAGVQLVCDDIRADVTLTHVFRHQLAGIAQERLQALGARVPIRDVRRLVGIGRANEQIARDAPDWARSWAWCNDGDVFFNLATKEKITERSFNANHTRYMEPFMDEDGRTPSASSHALDVWRLPVVSHLAYMPMAGDTFEMLGYTWGNLYRPGMVPGEDPDWRVPGTEAYDAVAAVENHLCKLITNDRERRLFLSWLAQNVKQPGRKIRWAPYIHGIEGDGKTFFANLLASVMGGANVRTVSGSTIESSSFTDWAVGYAVVIIEEMKLQGHNRYDVANKLKPFITNDQIEVHPKGKASYSAPNCSNYLAVSNYLDGAPVTESDRRYFFLSTGITTEEAEAMNLNGHFAQLFQAMTHGPALRSWLLAYDLDPEFDSNGRAPHTEARKAAIELSRTDTESVARDIIDQETEGVSREVISSSHLSAAIKAKLGADAEISTHKVSALLSRIGFRFIGRHFWRGDHRRVWCRGAQPYWSQAKERLDATVGREFANADR